MRPLAKRKRFGGITIRLRFPVCMSLSEVCEFGILFVILWVLRSVMTCFSFHMLYDRIFGHSLFEILGN